MQNVEAQRSDGVHSKLGIEERNAVIGEISEAADHHATEHMPGSVVSGHGNGTSWAIGPFGHFAVTVPGLRPSPDLIAACTTPTAVRAGAACALAAQAGFAAMQFCQAEGVGAGTLTLDNAVTLSVDGGGQIVKAPALLR